MYFLRHKILKKPGQFQQSSVEESGQVNVSFLHGQSKVAPSQATSIPRLELCDAVLLCKTVSKTVKALVIHVDESKFYSDSNVVLGYLQNESRGFHINVANRVQTIRDNSNPDQWIYINRDNLATRGIDGKSSCKITVGKQARILERSSYVATMKENVAINDDNPEEKGPAH